MLASAAWMLLAAPLGAQRVPADSAPEEVRRIAGRVMRGTPKGLQPLPGMRVTLHRVGPDKAGPLDSALTAKNGSYSFSFRPFGSSDAVYFVSVRYGGIAYFSEPTRQSAEGDAAAITVFDTTSAAVPIRLAGRHLVISAPAQDGRREVAEVFDLSNDSSVTRVSRRGISPTFVAHLPAGARDVKANPAADIAPEAVKIAGDSVMLFAPLSPGIRQLSFVYTLATDAFPLKVPLVQAVTVFEVLTEEPAAQVSAPHLREVQPVSADKRTFKRFLAEDVPANSVVTVDVPAPAFPRGRYITILAVIIGAVMLAALLIAVWRRVPRPASRVPLPAGTMPSADDPDHLLREIAAIDGQLERTPDMPDEERARVRAQREILKARLAALLAAQRSAE